MRVEIIIYAFQGKEGEEEYTTEDLDIALQYAKDNNLTLIKRIYELTESLVIIRRRRKRRNGQKRKLR